MGVVVLVFANPSWATTHAGTLDPWVYPNYWSDFGNIAGSGWWSGYYKVSRVTFTVVGNVGWNLLGPSTFQYVLVVGCLAAGALLGYRVLRGHDLHSRLLCAASLAFLPDMHNSSLWFFHYSLGTVLQIGVIGSFVLTAARFSEGRSTSWRNILTGAVFAALLVTAQDQFLSVLPFWLMASLVLLRSKGVTESRLLRVVRYQLELGFGAAGCVLFLSIQSVVFGSRFDFWVPMVEAFRYYGLSGHEVWWTGFGTGWWREASYLALPLFALVVSVSRLIYAKVAGRSLLVGSRLLLVGHIVTCGIWLFNFMIMKFWSLNLSYAALPITVTGVLAIASSTSRSISTRHQKATACGRDETSSFGYQTMFAWVPVLLLSVPVLHIQFLPSLLSEVLRGGIFVELFALSASLVLWAAVSRAGRGSTKALLLGAVLAFGSVLVAGERTVYSVLDECQRAAKDGLATLEIAERFSGYSPMRPIQVIAVTGTPKESDRSCRSNLASVAFSLSYIAPFTNPSSSVTSLQEVPTAIREWNPDTSSRDIVMIFDTNTITSARTAIVSLKQSFPSTNIFTCNGEIHALRGVNSLCITLETP